MRFLSRILCCLSLMVWAAAQAAETSSARQCRIEGGQPWTVNYSSSEDVMLCLFGSAGIGAQEFAEFKWSGSKAASLRAVLTAPPSGGGAGTCRLSQAEYREATDSSGTPWGLCLFSDGSTADSKTLARGRSDSRNRELIGKLR